MNFLSSAFFWGCVIILIGLSIIFKEVFHINIPVFRIVFGLLLLILGIKVISGGFGRKHRNAAIFSESSMAYSENQNEYNILFGNGTIDLFKIEPGSGMKKIEVNVVFGNGVVILNDSIPAMVEMNTVFGSSVAEGRQANGFGKSTYTTSAFNANTPYVLIESNCVFGKLVVQSKKW